MCLGDWRFGRLIRAQQTPYNLSAASTLSFLANRQRVGYSIGNSVNALTSSPGLVLAINGNDFFGMNTNQGLFHCTMVDYGELPTLPFSIRASGSGALGVVIEYIAPEAVLAAFIQEFSRRY